MARVQVQFFAAVALFVAGFSYVFPQVQHTQSEFGGSEKAKLNASYDLDSYGILSMDKWRNNGDVFIVDVQRARCFDIEECLSSGPFDKYPGREQDIFNFYILPSGQIVKRIGWDRKNDTVKISLVPLGETQPSVVMLEAFAFLMQSGVSLGKVQKSFRCLAFERSHLATDNAHLISRWCRSYKNIFDNDLLVYRNPVVGEVEVVFRSEWDPTEPTRDLDTITTATEVVKVTYPSCSSHYRCSDDLQDLRQRQIRDRGDLFTNFILSRDGRIYEGLGWNSTAVEKVIHIHFLVGSQDSAPRMLALTAFSLLIGEGIKLGKISQEFRVDMTWIGSKVIKEEIEKWVVWSRKSLVDKATVTVLSEAGKDTPVAKSELLRPLIYPVGNVLFTTSPGGGNGIPFIKRLQGKTITNAKQIRSNFYFAGDEVAYEGLGWNQTATEDEVVFEFLIPDSGAIPSNQSFLVSTFLIREAVKKGYLKGDYNLMVADHTSTQFESVVRLWDGRVRD